MSGSKKDKGVIKISRPETTTTKDEEQSPRLGGAHISQNENVMILYEDDNRATTTNHVRALNHSELIPTEYNLFAVQLP